MAGQEVIDCLAARWRALLPAQAETAACEHTFAALVAAYQAPGRHYHTLTHVAALLDLAEAEAPCWHDRATVELAIFFHDAVYEIGRADNEAASARLANDALGQLSVDPERCRGVARYIEATAHLTAERAGEPDLSRFLDLDLSILAAPPGTYDAYAAAVRQEYAVVEEAAWRTGRARVLRSFLKRERLFLCDDHHAAWDARARANLVRELAGLSG